MNQASGHNTSNIRLNPVWIWLLAILGTAITAISLWGFFGTVILLVLPFSLFFGSLILRKPKTGLWISLVASFLVSGLARYLNAPWGLSLDIVLFISWLGVILGSNMPVKRLKNDIFILSGIWFAYLCLELVNPSGNGIIAWFYAMRGIGFYQFMAFGLMFMFFNKKKDLYNFIYLLIGLSILGTLWGFKQQMGILDPAENHWLFAEEHHEEHILHGVLRVFSFYSDAGQFGASQAMMSLLCGILFLGPHKPGKKLFFLIAAILCFLGFAISGTRGALAVPAFGGLFYLIATRNFRILIAGISAFALVFYILKFTFLFQGVEQVRRMRSALDPENPSLMVRLENQKTFGRYLADKPFGGGVGTAGFWGYRFNPNSLMANTATDSWYVKIWAETGIVGISLHIGILCYVMGMGFKVIGYLRNPELKNYALALYGSIGGVLFGSYGNQVFGQMPTGMIMNMAIPLLFIIPHLESKNKTS